MNYTTVDAGRLHIANNENYQGNVNCYNNCLTRSFSKLFGKSINITIGNSVSCVNKKSYIKFLSTLGLQGCTPKTLEDYKDFDSLSCKFINSKGLMRNYLTSSKTDELGRQMIGALVRGNVEKATKFLYKGAEVNQLFWNRDPHSITFSAHLARDLPPQRLAPITAHQYTPFLQAVATKQHAFADLLKAFGANPDIQGKSCTFSRDILGVNNSTSLRPAVHAYYAHNHHRNRTEVVYRNGVDVVQTQTINYIDRYENITPIGFNHTTNSLKHTGNPRTESVQWNTNDDVRRFRLI